MELQAVIFDLNGTVLSDEDEYGAAFAIVLGRLGVGVNSKYPHVAGIGVEENWPIFIKKYKIKTKKSIKELADETQNEYFKLIPKVTLNKGFFDFVNKLRKAGIKTALATSNSRGMVEKVFTKFNIEDLFDSVTTGEEVSLKKPAPQIFLKTKDKLNVISTNCVVIEDAASGIEAAKLAGMKTIGLARSKTHELELKKADLVVNGFSELSLDRICKLFSKFT
jgi:beta-phosphoglucomutase